jgi:hypothetical protein
MEKTSNHSQEIVSYKKTFLLLLALFVSFIATNAQKTIFDGSLIHYSNFLKPTTKEGTTNTFNYNPVILKDFLDVDSNSLKKTMPESSTTFLAFVSKSKVKEDMIQFSSGKTKINITNQKIESPFLNIDVTYTPDKGMILSYLFNILPSKKNKFIQFNKDFITADDSTNRMLEVIVFPHFLPNSVRQILETYLSIKYGISLSSNLTYYNSMKKIIWDTLQNRNFNYRITGIGRDDTLNLYQKQSENSQMDGLKVGLDKIQILNSENQGSINNRTFVLWGDNGKTTKLIQDCPANFSKIARKWKTQTTCINKEQLTVQMVVDPKILFDQVDTSDIFPIWLVQFSEKDSSNVVITRQDSSSNLIPTFSHIVIDSSNRKSNCFTFIQAPDFFATSNVSYDGCKCQGKGNIDFDFYGGTPPFTIKLSGNNYSNNYTSIGRHYQIMNVPSGNFKIEYIESKGSKFTNRVTIENDLDDININLVERTDLNENKEALIKPEFHGNIDQMTFSWSKDSASLAKTLDLTVTDTGVYTLKAINNKGCIKNYKVYVGSKTEQPDLVSIFPNPVMVFEKFTLLINLNKESDVEIKVYNSESKCLKTIKKQAILTYSYKDEITTSGVYLISVKTNSKQYNLKLVVNQ